MKHTYDASRITCFVRMNNAVMEVRAHRQEDLNEVGLLGSGLL